MPNSIPIDKAIKEAHLDYLLHLAFMYEDGLMTNEAAADSRRSFSTEEEAAFSRAYSKARERTIIVRKVKQRLNRKNAMRRNFRKWINVAACIILLLGVATPFAVANIEFIRVRVMRLLIDIQEDRTNVSIQEDMSASFFVPAEWKGQYYPSYLPEGYSLSLLPENYCIAVFNNANGDEIVFEEYNEYDEVVVDSEDSHVAYGQINGNVAFIVEKKNSQIIWCNGSHLFYVTAPDTPIARQVAEGVCLINN